MEIKSFNHSKAFDFNIFREKSHSFFLTIAGTKTIYHDGISAAGANQESLAFTAALDSEYLELGKVKTVDKLPVSPAGIVSPVIVSKACLNLTEAKSFVIDAGAFIKPQIPLIDLYSSPADSIETGFTMTIEKVHTLFNYGRQVAKKYLNFSDYMILSECVVGGTTTALGLLTALGYDCFDMVSSSIPKGNHSLKQRLVLEGFEKATKRDDFKKLESNPLYAISILGDPMQAVVAGMAIESIFQEKPVVLAGGSQMIALASLVKELALADDLGDLLSIATSPWIVNDASAKTRELAEYTCKNVPIIYADLNPDDYANSVFDAYFQGHVKEGVGAGALMALSNLSYEIDGKALDYEISRLYRKELSLTIEQI